MSHDRPVPPTRPATPEEWRAYLLMYGDIYLRTANEYRLPGITEEQRRTRWLGRAPATEEAVAAAEERLGVRLPPSLRAFLKASDGWPAVDGWTEAVCSCAELAWMRESEGSDYIVDMYRDLGEADEYVALFERALEVAYGEDLWLLDPARVNADGEWGAVLFEVKYGELKEFPDFIALVHDSYATMTTTP
ncbi:SMI1/KNR4 family protein [Streptomonospora sp. S1-112]|uniref:SMI1/KNR4 family protein n=1 Tax=Streptomonospora mangrovi TaxID=2883123 RepID=A0A9X3NJI5_9ACTN|nr:SMI1/KNR4 family protein [Streptomonospora mangrovi]MDA0564994.1 SMI1/KNR4 family protein [Streptomonospora mangrovi]